jgi:hypothetical protein
MQPLRAARIEMQESIWQRRGVAMEGQATELAPGGHQEQGESRVTVFRAPDSRKASGVEAADSIELAPSTESISGSG